MLNSLSGKVHKVITSVCLYSINKKVVFQKKHQLGFHLDDEIITHYMKNIILLTKLDHMVSRMDWFNRYR